MFDVRAQFDGCCRHQFSALEDLLLCQLIPRATFIELCDGNPPSPATSPPAWHSGNNSRSSAPSWDRRIWRSSS
jgi:hypothetical protein